MMCDARHVYWHKASQKWIVKIKLIGKSHHLGLFTEKQDAARAAHDFREIHNIEHSGEADILSRIAYDDGRLVWRQHGAGHNAGEDVGSIDKASGYRALRIVAKKLYVHRMVWELINGPIPPGLEIDHINGARADNRIENLRVVNRAANQKNTRLRSRHFPGVTETPSGRFSACFTDSGKRHYLGVFGALEDAIAARLHATKNVGFHKNHGRTS